MIITKYNDFKAINEAYISDGWMKAIFNKLQIDINQCKKLGEGNNGIAFKYNDKTVKITTDFEEAEFANIIKGKKLQYIQYVHDVIEVDTITGRDNKNEFVVSGARYYWVIIKDYVPYKFRDIYDSMEYYNILLYFDKYQTKDFNYTSDDFQRMYNEYETDYIEMMTDEDSDYEAYDDDDLQTNLMWLNVFQTIHSELQPLGIESVSDMKSDNIGYDDESEEPVFLELHVYRWMANPIETEFKTIFVE